MTSTTTTSTTSTTSTVSHAFTQGHSYFGRFICNYDTVVTVEVVKRTPKSVVVRDTVTGETCLRRVRIFRDRESIQYCAGLIISADREVC